MTIINDNKAGVRSDILNPGFDLTLRPMRHPDLMAMFDNGVANTWTINEVDLARDHNDLLNKLQPGERHLVHRLVAFFATGDEIVANNAALSLYKHINSPEARMYLSRQIFEEANHVRFYLYLLDAYLKTPAERAEAFDAVNQIESIRLKAQFAQKYISSIDSYDRLDTDEKKRAFLLNLICFSTCIEGLFFYAAFCYIFFLKSRDLLPGLADGTEWTLRDETMHMEFAYNIINIVRDESPHLFDARLEEDVVAMMEEAIECERAFAEEALSQSVTGLPLADVHTFLKYVADENLKKIGYAPRFGGRQPFPFMAQLSMYSHANFFERPNTAYAIGQLNTSDPLDFDATF